MRVDVQAQAEDEGDGENQPPGVLVPGLLPLVPRGPGRGEAVGKSIERPAQDLRDGKGRKRVLPHGRHGFPQRMRADVPQDEAQRIHKDEGSDGDFHRKVFPVADDNGQRHGERGKEHAVLEAGRHAADGDKGMQEGKAVDKVVDVPRVHSGEDTQLFRSSQKNVRSARFARAYIKRLGPIAYFCPCRTG